MLFKIRHPLLFSLLNSGEIPMLKSFITSGTCQHDSLLLNWALGELILKWINVQPLSLIIGSKSSELRVHIRTCPPLTSNQISIKNSSMLKKSHFVRLTKNKNLAGRALKQIRTIWIKKIWSEAGLAIFQFGHKFGFRIKSYNYLQLLYPSPALPNLTEQGKLELHYQCPKWESSHCPLALWGLKGSFWHQTHCVTGQLAN